jgi:hypothetical protein
MVLRPTFCTAIWYLDDPSRPQSEDPGADDIIWALGNPDRVSYVSLLNLPSSLFDRFIATMHDSFPSLTHLELGSKDGASAAILSDSFVGGSVPPLRSLGLHNIRFTALQTRLLSPNSLVHLHPLNTTYEDCILPNAMVTCLSSLTRLEDLSIGFQSPGYYPLDREVRHPPLPRIDLPSLTRLWFCGNSVYLDQLVSRINAPLLHILEMVFLNHVYFDILKLTEFIDRAERFKVLDRAEILFHGRLITVTLSSQKEAGDRTILSVKNRSRPKDWL